MDDAGIITRRYYALMLIGIFLPFLLYPLLSLFFLSAGQDMVYRLTCSRFLIWGIAALLFVYARQAEVQPFLLWRDEPFKFPFYIASILLMYLLVIVAGIISRIPSWLGLNEDDSVLLKYLVIFKRYPLLLVFSAITAGFTEELIFRGYMISRLSLFFKDNYLPVVISSLLFSAIHYSYKNLGELIFAFLIGILFGFHYQKYRNIKVLIVLHAIVDLIALSVPRPH